MQTLSRELEEKVCTCKSRFNLSGWSLDPSTGYWVHRHGNKEKPCNKPSRFSSIFECDECDELFFAETPEDIWVCSKCK